MRKAKKKVLFICTHNSARSQMAEAWLRTLFGSRYEAFSAGTHPAPIHPAAVKVMKEAGVDISRQQSKTPDVFLKESFDLVITVCNQAREECPFFPGGKKRIHKSFPDPSRDKGDEEQILEVFRNVRDQIKEWIVSTFSG